MKGIDASAAWTGEWIPFGLVIVTKWAFGLFQIGLYIVGVNSV